MSIIESHSAAAQVGDKRGRRCVLHGIEADFAGCRDVPQHIVAEKNLLRRNAGKLRCRAVDFGIGFHRPDLKAESEDRERGRQDPVVRRHEPLPLKIAGV